METNIREVSFSSSYTEHLYGFAQYDRGQKLKITGIHTDANTEVHFSLSASGGESPRVLPDSTGAETIVSVPDFVFCADRMYDYEAYAFVCYSDVNVGKTERRIIMHIKSRPKPADFAPPSEPDLTQKVLQELGTKLTAPSSAQIGQIFRVQSITEDGNLVLEAVDMPSGGSGGAVDDVRIDGKSIVGENGVANIPTLNGMSAGLCRTGADKGVLSHNGQLYLSEASNSQIAERNKNKAILPSNIDYAVKAAMCDGKGAEWTADEQAMARARMGFGNYELILDYTTTADDESAADVRINFEKTDYTKLYIIFDESGIEGTTYSSVRFGLIYQTQLIDNRSLANTCPAFKTNNKWKTFKCELLKGFGWIYQATSEVQLYGYVSTSNVGRVQLASISGIGGIAWYGTMYAGTNIKVWGFR